MSFSVEFLGCKISQTDMQGVRERLLAGGLEETREGGAVHVVNTCCVTHEAVAKSRKAVRSALRRGAEHVYVTGCATRLGGDALGPADARVTVVRETRRGGRRAHRARARRDGVRRPGAAPRAHARVRQGAGRLHVRVRVLRDPARARREPLAPAARRARRGAAAHRAGAPRARRDGRQPRPLPRRRGARQAARRPARARRARRHRARPAVLDRGQPPQPAALRRARAPARLPAPARAAAVGRRRRAARHAPPLRPRDLRAPHRARPRRRARAQPHGRRHRRLPGRGRRRLRAHARGGRGARASRACTSSRTRRGPARARPTPTPCRRPSSAAAPSACARSPTASATRAARRASGLRDHVLVERVDADGRLHGYGADYTAYELRAHAGAGVGDLVEVVLEAPGERAAQGRVL